MDYLRRSIFAIIDIPIYATMPKKTTPVGLALPPRDPGAPIGRWLYSAVRKAILEGRIRPGTRLPSTRDLARAYGIARGTVVQVFEELAGEGYLEARVGSGTRVSRDLPDGLLNAGTVMPSRRSVKKTPPRSLSGCGSRVRLLRNLAPGPVRAFRANQPALDLFPTALWAQIAGRRLNRASMDLLLSCAPMGYMPLREAVADYLATSRGVACTADRVAIVSGVQEALDLATRLLVDPGDRVAVESPGYDGATLLFESLGVSESRVPVDDEGITIDERALAGARLIYVTPAHQFPLGVSMSLPRRLTLLEWAANAGALIFEDDYDSEYRYSGKPLPALQGLDRHDAVLFAGSFSKVLFPSMRLGYLVVPEDLVDRFAGLLSVTRRHAPLLEQAVLTDFLVGGHLGRHLRRMRDTYGERLAVLLEAAENHLRGLLEVSDVEAGLQTVGWLQRGLDELQAMRAAARRRVEVTDLGRYGSRAHNRPGLLLGFAAIEPHEIRRGVSELAAALQEGVRRPTAG